MAGIRGVIKWAGVRSRCSERAHPRLIGAGRRHPADAGAASEINAPAKPVETPPRRPWTRVRFPPPPPILLRRTPAAVHYTAGVDQPADILSAAPGASSAAGLALAARPGPARRSASRSRSSSPRPAWSSCSPAARSRPAHRADGAPAHHPDRGERALAGAAVVVAARRPLRLAGAAVRAVDRRLRVHAGGHVGGRRRLLRDGRLRPRAARRGGRVPRDPGRDRRAS